MPRIKEYNSPPDLLDRLPKSGIVTKGDKLAAFDTLLHRADVHWRAARVRIFEAIRNDIRAAHHAPAHKDSAPVQSGAPSKAEDRTEQGSSIPPKALERKIRIQDDVFRMFHNIGAIDVRKNGEHFLLLTPDEADQLAHALTELADDLRQDIAARAWSQDLLEQQR